MPCRSDYTEASGRELESRRVCRLLIYDYGAVRPVPTWITKAADDYYGNLNRLLRKR